MNPRFSIRTKDTVKVLAGIDKGKTGKVLQVLPEERRAVVEGVNQRTKNVRARKQINQKGEKITYNAPLHLSNLMLVCPHCHKPTRVAHVTHDGKKQRQCKKCKQYFTASS